MSITCRSRRERAGVSAALVMIWPADRYGVEKSTVLNFQQCGLFVKREDFGPYKLLSSGDEAGICRPGHEGTEVHGGFIWGLRPLLPADSVQVFRCRLSREA